MVKYNTGSTVMCKVMRAGAFVHLVGDVTSIYPHNRYGVCFDNGSLDVVREKDMEPYSRAWDEEKIKDEY